MKRLVLTVVMVFLALTKTSHGQEKEVGLPPELQARVQAARQELLNFTLEAQRQNKSLLELKKDVEKPKAEIPIAQMESLLRSYHEFTATLGTGKDVAYAKLVQSRNLERVLVENRLNKLAQQPQRTQEEVLQFAELSLQHIYFGSWYDKSVDEYAAGLNQVLGHADLLIKAEKLLSEAARTLVTKAREEDLQRFNQEFNKCTNASHNNLELMDCRKVIPGWPPAKMPVP